MTVRLLLWAMFVGAVLAIGTLLLPACELVAAAGATLVGRWSFCPGAPSALSVEAARSDSLRKLAMDLESELALKNLSCASTPPPPPAPLQLPSEAGPPRAQQTAALKPPPGPLPADRWDKKDLGMLQGCWRLGRETQSTLGLGGGQEICQVKTGRICFGANGSGTREQLTICPTGGTQTCTAPITATFGNDRMLHTRQPQVPCSANGIVWNGQPNWLSCRRVSDTLAICTDAQFEHEFRR